MSPPTPRSDRGVKAQLSGALCSGGGYRRKGLVLFSNAVDRHLKKLVDGVRLIEIGSRCYLVPRNPSARVLPPDASELVALFSPTVYNSAGLGTTLLSNRPWSTITTGMAYSGGASGSLIFE